MKLSEVIKLDTDGCTGQVLAHFNVHLVEDALNHMKTRQSPKWFKIFGDITRYLFLGSS